MFDYAELIESVESTSPATDQMRLQDGYSDVDIRQLKQPSSSGGRVMFSDDSVAQYDVLSLLGNGDIDLVQLDDPQFATADLAQLIKRSPMAYNGKNYSDPNAG